MELRKKQAIRVIGIIICFAGIVLAVSLSKTERAETADRGREKSLLFEMWDAEDKINRIDEAVNKKWFPAGDDHVMLLEARRFLNEKLAETKTAYEKERRKKVKEIVKESRK